MVTKESKIDPRVRILKYINKKGEEEKYPEIGFPLQIFLIAEHEPIKFFTSSNHAVSEYYLFSGISYRQELSLCLKSLLFCGLYSLIEYSACSINTKLYVFSIFESLIGGFKIVNLNLLNNNLKLNSLSLIYRSATWLEREVSDFFGINHKGLLDTRKLMLDYSTTKGIMKNKPLLDSLTSNNTNESVRSTFIGNYYYNW